MDRCVASLAVEQVIDWCDCVVGGWIAASGAGDGRRQLRKEQTDELGKAVLHALEAVGVWAERVLRGVVWGRRDQDLRHVWYVEQQSGPCGDNGVLGSGVAGVERQLKELARCPLQRRMSLLARGHVPGIKSMPRNILVLRGDWGKVGSFDPPNTYFNFATSCDGFVLDFRQPAAFP
jgi:hypothetical protein